MNSSDPHSQRQQIAALQEQLRQLEDQRRPAAGTVSSGAAALDRRLPEGGFRRGTLVEWLGSESGAGAVTLALLAARSACREQGALVVLDFPRRFYPPAAAAWGLDWQRIIVVGPTNKADAVWAADQALRCPGVSAVVAWPERLTTRDFRRLQLAAESGTALGMLVRPAEARTQPAWSDVRLWIEPRPAVSGRRWRVEVLRMRGGSGCVLELQLDELTGVLHEPTSKSNAVHLASPLAAPKTPRRSAGA